MVKWLGMENTKSIEKIEALPCVLIYKNIFNPDSFIEKIEQEAARPWPYLEWKNSFTGGDGAATISEYRTSLEIYLGPLLQNEINDDLKDVQRSLVVDIMEPLEDCIWDYRSVYDLNLTETSGYQLLKYQNESEYHLHQDHAPDNSRVMSLVACLSDNFVGGELEFPYFNYTVKLEKGSIIFFPSNFPYSHIAHPVTDGIKYSLVSWYR